MTTTLARLSNKVSNFLLGQSVRIYTGYEAAQRYFANSLSRVSDSVRDTQRGYESAGFGRYLKQWFPSLAGPDEEILRDLPTLRTRSRDLYKNNTIGRAAIRTTSSNAIGRGLKLQSGIDFEFLGMTPEAAAEWEENTERRFRNWASTSEVDAGRRLNFFELTNLAFLSKLQSGDVFVALPIIERAGQENPLRIKLIEADMVATPPGFSQHSFPKNTRVATLGIDSFLSNIREGIELGPHGDPINYHIFAHGTWHVVPAFGELTSRPNILHLYEQERPGQSRGVPFIAPVIEKVKQLGRYEDSELAAAVVSSMFTVFIRSSNPDALESPLKDVQDARGTNSSATVEDSFDYQLAPGSIQQLQDNEDITFADPSRPNSSYRDYIDTSLRQIGMALEIPFEILTKQFQSSFSASKAARIEADKFFMRLRGWMAQKFCQPIYVEWLTEEVGRGFIEAPGFFQSPDAKFAWCNSAWVGDSMGIIDELKAVNAANAKIKSGLSDYETEVQKMAGVDWKKMIKRLKQQQDIIRDLGVAVEAPQEETPDANAEPLDRLVEAVGNLTE